jgi:threonine dehydrogenase-like Zn-dependent dehydrogenase
MQAMVLKKLKMALDWTDLPDPQPGSGEIRVKVAACGVCRTDLYVADGELPDAKLPIIPGHEIVGRIDAIGAGVDGLRLGERVGIPWLGHTCGVCSFCTGGRRLRDGGGRRCALRFPARRGRQRHRARASAVRRLDRLALAGDCRCLQEFGTLWIRRRRPHPGSGREVAGPVSIRLHATG